MNKVAFFMIAGGTLLAMTGMFIGLWTSIWK
jgi:hypothetical protein